MKLAKGDAGLSNQQPWDSRRSPHCLACTLPCLALLLPCRHVTGNGTATSIFLAGTVLYQAPSAVAATATSASGNILRTTMVEPQVIAMDVVVDRTCSGGATRKTVNNTDGNVDFSAQEAARLRMGLPLGASWQGGPVDLPAGGVSAAVIDNSGPDLRWGQDPWGTDTAVPALPLTLAVWVDASVIEAYAMGGHARVTTR